MIDAIDRDELDRKLYKLKVLIQQRKSSSYNYGYLMAINDAINKMRDCASLETTAVVRCKDCRHATDRYSTMPYCSIHNRSRGPDDFCNFGENDNE